MAKFFKEKTTTVIDKQTGEVLSQQEDHVTFSKVKSEEHFFMVFINFISPFFNLKSDACKTILIKLCTLAEWNTGKISLSTNRRAELCKELDCSSQTFSNCLTTLKKHHLIWGKGGEFQINPQLFWKGDVVKRNEQLKDIIVKINFGLATEEEIRNYEEASKQKDSGITELKEPEEWYT